MDDVRVASFKQVNMAHRRRESTQINRKIDNEAENTPRQEKSDDEEFKDEMEEN